jgi:universal stress protein A
MLKPTKILVPTDFSEYSDKALRQALDIAKQYNGKVYLFHVVGQLLRVAIDYAIPEDDMRTLGDLQVASARDMLQAQLDKFPAAKEVDVTVDVARGNPAEAILEEERKREIDLIVIASLGTTGLAKYFIGGVARNVLKGAKAPVLLTK